MRRWKRRISTALLALCLAVPAGVPAYAEAVPEESAAALQDDFGEEAAEETQGTIAPEETQPGEQPQTQPGEEPQTKPQEQPDAEPSSSSAEGVAFPIDEGTGVSSSAADREAAEPVGSSGESDEQEEVSEWTVLFYFCGSDLESEHGYASQSLKEMLGVIQYYSLLSALGTQPEGHPDAVMEEMPPGKVSVLVETGGASAWKAQENGLDVDIKADKLERWSYGRTVKPGDGESEITAPAGLVLEEMLPLQNMASPQTLSDFIAWGAKTAPAKKYALVLWDHGGGSKTGLFADEMFEGAYMDLAGLHKALGDGGVHFEAVLFDACLMANIETAAAIQDYASWMVASEELVPGGGTDVAAWLQELVNNPACDGRQLGRVICDTTQQKYANTSDDQSNNLLTWSVIDLAKMPRLVDDFDKMFEIIGYIYENYPHVMELYGGFVRKSGKFGNGTEGMYDLASAIYLSQSVLAMDYAFRSELIEAFSDAVVYCVKGPGKSDARGLSYCYAFNFSSAEIAGYAANCPSPHYLALLDAISTWTAPDTVYEKAQRLKEQDEDSAYNLTVRKTEIEGLPGFLTDGLTLAIYYNMYMLDEDSGQTVRLGRSLCRSTQYDESTGYSWVANDPISWVYVEDTLADMELVYESANTWVYNIPVKIGQDQWFFRCGREFAVNAYEQIYTGEKMEDPGSYTIYGLWEGYDSDSNLPSRNVSSISQMQGREFRLAYPVASGSGSASYVYAAPQEMYRILSVEERKLPAGTYYIEYEIMDVFGRTVLLPKVELHWDGNEISFADGFTWEGEERLNFKK